MLPNEQFYKEVIEKAANYNSKLLSDRKMRLPFLDSQTGIAQSNCHIWVTQRQRFQGKSCTQLYSYPAKRWKKKKRSSSWNDIKIGKTSTSGLSESDIHAITTVENPAVVCIVDRDRELFEGKALSTSLLGGGSSSATAIVSAGGSSSHHYHHHSAYHPYINDDSSLWYDEYDDIMDDATEPGDLDDADSDGSEYDEKHGHIIKKKKRKVTTNRGGKRKRFDDREDGEIKPYICDRKSTPGKVSAVPGRSGGHGQPPLPQVMYSTSMSGGSVSVNAAVAAGGGTATGGATSTASSGGSGNAHPSPYCDFCMGDSVSNKKTGKAEHLVSCGDCGRSGHPSCLQFTDNMIVSVKKYSWQCIECKSCGLCGTSDNDDQLLFCDDCDRGYHMYCLNPPLYEPPEGSWSCHLCIKEFGAMASIHQQPTEPSAGDEDADDL